MKRLDEERRALLAESFKRYRAGMLHIARKIVRDQATAEDCVETVFHRLKESKKERLRSIENMRAYLYDAARNAALDYVELHAYKNWTDLDLDLFDSSYCDPLQTLEQRERNAMIVEMLNKLKPKHLEVLMLSAEGKSNKEIAAMLQITEDNVKTIKSRGRKQLHDLLEKERN